MLIRPFTLVVCVATLLVTSVAYASDFTNLNDAADDFDDLIDETYDPFDISLVPSFTFEQSKGVVAREGACVPSDSDLRTKDEELAKELGRTLVDSTKCKERPEVVDIEQLDYISTKMTLDTTLRIGIYKDFEFRATLPYVINASSGVKGYKGMRPRTIDPFNEDVEKAAGPWGAIAKKALSPKELREAQAKILPTFLGNRLFHVPTSSFEEVKRQGLGDPTFGLHWGLYNDQRDDTKATLNIGLDYTPPLAPIKEIDNTNVGEGLHQINLSFKGSKRYGIFEPYFGIELIGRLFSENSPLKPPAYNVKDEGKTVENKAQDTRLPPQTGKITFGTEIIPWEHKPSGQRYAIDLRFMFEYRSTGRYYSPLLDQFGGSECKGKQVTDLLPKFDNAGKLENADDFACSWLLLQPSNISSKTPLWISSGADNSGGIAEAYNKGITDTFSYNGVATIDGYATFSGRLALNLQPVQYVSVNLFGTLGAETNHLISGGSVGKNGDDDIRLEDPEKSQLQRNPTYNEELDGYGHRLKMLDYVTWSVGIQTQIMF